MDQTIDEIAETLSNFITERRIDTDKAMLALVALGNGKVETCETCGAVHLKKKTDPVDDILLVEAHEIEPPAEDEQRFTKLYSMDTVKYRALAHMVSSSPHDPWTVTSLADEFELERSSINKALQEMEIDGWVYKTKEANGPSPALWDLKDTARAGLFLSACAEGAVAVA